ncbi:unnamed protein product [Mycena citricolor]|uniref:Uncharacterized protein n=1 Tax=Mycena citricolor TaxID=2018698 RepID=A0AAD2K3D1_9AGAR|nr:unnamed protein product [Mycena citricolor]CAK5276700.1 unnamed protein product [Mycena citricolor]
MILLQVVATAFFSLAISAAAEIDRHGLVTRYNPRRNASSSSTPMQVGNGNFAFGADVTGLQTLQPWAIMSSWGWKNDTLPANKTVEDVADYSGVSLDNHGRLVEYMFNGPAPLQQWMIANPNRVNLGNIGLVFFGSDGARLNVTEADLSGVDQVLDIWTGTLTSRITFNGSDVTVTTVCGQEDDTIGVKVLSPLLDSGLLGVFMDFPWNDGSAKFSAPFVGSWTNANLHTTQLLVHGSTSASISHTIGNSTFSTSIGAGNAINITRDSPNAHRYTLRPVARGKEFTLSTTWGTSTPQKTPAPFESIRQSSNRAWQDFWLNSGFVDVLTGSSDARADELQRRIILSRYLMRVNEAGDFPPQEVRCRFSE